METLALAPSSAPAPHQALLIVQSVNRAMISDWQRRNPDLARGAVLCCTPNEQTQLVHAARLVAQTFLRDSPSIPGRTPVIATFTVAAAIVVYVHYALEGSDNVTVLRRDVGRAIAETLDMDVDDVSAPVLERAFDVILRITAGSDPDEIAIRRLLMPSLHTSPLRPRPSARSRSHSTGAVSRSRAVSLSRSQSRSRSRSSGRARHVPMTDQGRAALSRLQARLDLRPKEAIGDFSMENLVHLAGRQALLRWDLALNMAYPAIEADAVRDQILAAMTAHTGNPVDPDEFDDCRHMYLIASSGAVHMSLSSFAHFRTYTVFLTDALAIIPPRDVDVMITLLVIATVCKWVSAGWTQFSAPDAAVSPTMRDVLLKLGFVPDKRNLVANMNADADVYDNLSAFLYSLAPTPPIPLLPSLASNSRSTRRIQRHKSLTRRRHQQPSLPPTPHGGYSRNKRNKH